MPVIPLEELPALLQAINALAELSGIFGCLRLLPAISQPGDLWRIGDHYSLCGNALDAESKYTAVQRLSWF